MTDSKQETANDFTFTTDLYAQLTQPQVYGKVIGELARANPDIVLLFADLMRAYKIEDYCKVFPTRFFNFGIAENNMVAAAAGMAVSGKLPFLSTMATFLSLRCAETIRTDIAYPNLPVKIIATNAGVTLGTGGPSHHATEDIAILRSMANMTVVVPADSFEIAKVVRATEKEDGPIYVRIGRAIEPLVHENDIFDFAIGKSITLCNYGTDAAVVACGVCVKAAIDAADELKKEGIKITVIDMHTIKPLDTEAVLCVAQSSSVLVTAEEHSIIGGLGSAVAETLAEAGMGIKFKRLGLPDVYSTIGNPEDLYMHYKINKNGIKEAIKSLLE